MEARDYLRKIIYKKGELDDWFAGMAFPVSRYDPDLGYVFAGGRYTDGIDGASSVYSYDEDGLGPRHMITYAERNCRINSYGDSFTQCDQVSDGETWQERLAAHLWEPIRNFGVGGYSVYQSYLRMKREERKRPAEFIIFNIYSDDHYRNLVPWARMRYPELAESRFSVGPTVPYVVSLPRGRVEERPNPCSTPRSYYRLCDLDATAELFKDDFAMKIMMAKAAKGASDAQRSREDLLPLARKLGFHLKLPWGAGVSETADALFAKAALTSSMRIVENVEAFAKAADKKVLYVLSHRHQAIVDFAMKGVRFDQEFVDFMKRKRLRHVDLIEAHLEDYSRYKIDVVSYLDQYFVPPVLYGHYSPLGNLFHAFAIKKELVAMLDPRPEPYKGFR